MPKAIVARGHSVEVQVKEATFDKAGKMIVPARSQVVGEFTEFEAPAETIETFRQYGAVMTEDQAEAYRKAEEEKRNTPAVGLNERVYGGSLEGHRLDLVTENGGAGTVFEGAADGTVSNKGGTQMPVEKNPSSTAADAKDGQTDAQRAAAERAAADKAAADKAAADKAAADKKAADDKAAADAAAARTQSTNGTQSSGGTKTDPLA